MMHVVAIAGSHVAKLHQAQDWMPDISGGERSYHVLTRLNVSEHIVEVDAVGAARDFSDLETNCDAVVDSKVCGLKRDGTGSHS